jgi:hypothetical protein
MASKFATSAVSDTFANFETETILESTDCPCDSEIRLEPEREMMRTSESEQEPPFLQNLMIIPVTRTL